MTGERVELGTCLPRRLLRASAKHEQMVDLGDAQIRGVAHEHPPPPRFRNPAHGFHFIEQCFGPVRLQLHCRV